MKKLEVFFVVVILVAAFIVRLYKIDRPVADWHSWRQADTAAVARNFVKSKFNLLYPQSDSFLALNDKGLPNPNRYFINEFPLYNAIVAIIYKQFGINTTYARFVSLSFSLLGVLFLYLATKKLLGFKIASLTIFYYAFNPYSIFYSTVIMPDPTFVSLSIASLYFCLTYVETKRFLYGALLASTFGAAMLVKPYAIFLILPIAYWIFLNWGFGAFKNFQLYLVTLASFIPFLLWRWHVFTNPEGAFASSWLFNQGNIRFTGAFFRWLIFERLNRIIFATGGFVLFVLGTVKSYQSKNSSFIFVWLASVLLYMTIFAKGNVNHDYYQLPIVPVGSVLVSLGAFTLFDLSYRFWAKVTTASIISFLIVLSFALGWYEVRGFFNINKPEIVEAGMRADLLLPKDAKVITPYGGDPAFLYQTNRYGYPIVDKPLEKFIDEGFTYLISVETGDAGIQNLAQDCKVIEQTQNYLIVEIYKECIGK